MMPSEAAFPGTDVVQIMLAILVGLGMMLVFFIHSHSYEVRAGVLIIRRRMLWFIPFGTIHIRLEDIRAVEVSGPFRFPSLLLIYGCVFAPDGLLLTLKRRRHVLFPRILITPDDLPTLMDEIADQIDVRPPVARARGRPLTDRVPLRLLDAFALVSAVSFGFLLVVTASPAWGWDLRPSALTRPAGIAVLVMLSVLALSMLLLMWAGLLRATLGRRRFGAVAWLLAVSLIPPLAWVYYVIKWRPQRLWRTGGGKEIGRK
jgi:hypothetical protein